MTAAYPFKTVHRSFTALIFVFGTAALFSACGPAGDDSAETFSAEPFRVLDSSSGESWISINGDRSRMLFGRHNEDWDDHVVFESVRSGATWAEPTVASFSGTWSDRGARFYPALDAVVFSSNRPVAQGDSTDDFNIWITQFDGESWAAPEPMTPLNSDANEYHPSVAVDGTIWFSSDRDGSIGGSDLWAARLGATGYEITRAPAPINSEYSEADAFIDPAGRYIVFSRTDDPTGQGGDDLYVSTRSNGAWSEPVNLGPAVNTPEYEYGPYVSRDGRTLFFTSHRSGTADIYRIGLDELSDAFPENLRGPFEEFRSDDAESDIEVTTVPADDSSE